MSKSKAGHEKGVPMKRFTNGHKTFTAPESDFLREIYNKDSKIRDVFVDSSHTLKKPRNPCLGELTSRDHAEYLIPFETSLKNTLDSVKYEESLKEIKSLQPLGDRDPRADMASFIVDVGKVEAMKNRRAVLNAELSLIKQAVKHQKACMALIGGEGSSKGVSSLHPAMEQTTKSSQFMREL